MTFSATLFVGLLTISNAAVLRQRTDNGQQVFEQKEASYLENIRYNVLVGSGSGTLLGAVVGAAGGFALEAPGTGALVGGVSGALAGGIGGWLWDPTPKKEEKTEIKTKEFEEPQLDKMKNQAEMAVAMSDYEQQRAEKKGDKKDATEEKAAEKKAKKVLADLQKTADEREKTGKKEPMSKNEGEFEDIQEVLAEGDTSEMVSAETAVENGAVTTANDLARVSGGGKGKRLRAEDMGAAGDKKSYQGDMIPGSKKQLALFQAIAMGAGHHNGSQTPGVAAGVAWPNGKVKYCFASDIPSAVRHIFKAACNQFHRAVPCLTFEDVGHKSGSSKTKEDDQLCNESPAIFVQSDPQQGCYSYVGMLSSYKSQRLQLQDPGCVSVGTAVHELGHALGMAHEQSRPDRNQYVKIHFDNIQKGMKNNFDMDKNAYASESYDLLSIMHYDAFAFAKDEKKPTIEYIGKGGHSGGLGQRAGLSKYDVSQTVAMYKDAGNKIKCKANALAGMGCLNKPDAKGNNVCDIKKCGGMAAKHCCACGGGVKVQCYKGQFCPTVKSLPAPAAADCVVDATSKFQGSGVPCIYENVCKFDVAFKCSGGCDNVAASKQFEATQCNDAFVTDVCNARHKCTFMKSEK